MRTPPAVKRAPITLWSGRGLSEADPTRHYWFLDREQRSWRLCDGAAWPDAEAPAPTDAAVYAACRVCDDLYVSELAHGRRLLNPADDPLFLAMHPPKFGGYTPAGVATTLPDLTAERRLGMDIQPIAMTSFARFYEATGPEKVKMVREARLFQSDPDRYIARDYYFDLRNTLRQTHWSTGDIDTFENALDALCSRQKQEGKQAHLRAIGESYLQFWRSRDVQLVSLPAKQIALASLPIRVAVEMGIVYHGDRLALKLWFNSPRATRAYRQTVKFLIDEIVTRGDWPSSFQPAILDVRRAEILPPVTVPRDLRRALEGQAGAFLQIWKGLDEVLADPDR